MNSHVINFLPSCLHLIGRIPLSNSYPDVRTEPKYIVVLSKLLLLFQFYHVSRSGKKPEMTAEQTGTAIVIKAVCTNSSCRKEFIWSSQPFMPGTKIFAGNFLIPMAVLFAGGSFTKVRQIFLHMGLACISLSTFFRHQQVSKHIVKEKKSLFWAESVNGQVSCQMEQVKCAIWLQTVFSFFFQSVFFFFSLRDFLAMK